MATLRPIKDLIREAPFNMFAIDPEVRERITANMEANGGPDPAYPVIVWLKDDPANTCFKEIVVDGNTRIEAALAGGFDSIYVEPREFPNDQAAVEYMIHCQRDRRNWTAAELAKAIIAVDKFRQKGQGGDHRSKAAKETLKGDTAQQTAEIVNTSRGTVQKVREVMDSPDEKIKQDLLTGKTSIDAAAKEARLKAINLYHQKRFIDNDPRPKATIARECGLSTGSKNSSSERYEALIKLSPRLALRVRNGEFGLRTALKYAAGEKPTPPEKQHIEKMDVKLEVGVGPEMPKSTDLGEFKTFESTVKENPAVIPVDEKRYSKPKEQIGADSYTSENPLVFDTKELTQKEGGVGLTNHLADYDPIKVGLRAVMPSLANKMGRDLREFKIVGVHFILEVEGDPNKQLEKWEGVLEW